MATADINDRSSLEQIYPREAFAADAAGNEKVPQEVLRGVRIRSAPDETGRFEIEPAAQHVGEASQVGQQTGSLFLAPFHQTDELVDRGRYSTPQQNSAAAPAAGYESFLDDIVTAARNFGEDRTASPGPADPRLRGPRQ